MSKHEKQERYPAFLKELREFRDSLDWDSVSVFALIEAHELIAEMVRYHRAGSVAPWISEAHQPNAKQVAVQQ